MGHEVKVLTKMEARVDLNSMATPDTTTTSSNNNNSNSKSNNSKARPQVNTQDARSLACPTATR